VFVGSLYGDSQLIKLLSEANEEGSHVQVMESYANIGPVMDMCVVQSEKQGQSQVVTCSGAFKDGSLRVVRSGIGIQEQASVDVPGIKGVWSLRSADQLFDKYLVQAFIGETRILAIQDEELSEDTIPGFSEEETIFCANIGGGLIVQVTQSRARLIDSSSLQCVFEFLAQKTVTVAAASAAQVVLALAGGDIVYFEVDAAARVLVQVMHPFITEMQLLICVSSDWCRYP